MKKVWIASILATLMLMVPMTSVVSANEIEDCNCNPINDLQVVRFERMLNRLESRINFILLKYGHIPEVAEKCEEISDVIHSNRVLNYPIICAIILVILAPLSAMIEIFNNNQHDLRDEYPILASFIDIFCWQLIIIYALLGASLFSLHCVDWEP